MKGETMDDLIDRQAAIDAILDMNAEHRVSWKDAVIDIIDELPSAQPEQVRCKGCKRYDSHGHRCKWWNHGVSIVDWCSHAERSDDERFN